MKVRIVNLTRDNDPDVALPVDNEFAGVYADATCAGALVATKAKVAFVGLARNIAGTLPVSIQRIQETAQHFADWKAFVVENDSTDGTKDILQRWAMDDPLHVIVQTIDNGRPHLHGFELARTEAMADYRNRCRELVQKHYPEADYVIVVDLDAWGGWSVHGVMNGMGWHSKMPKAGCMASTSLFKHQATLIDGRPPWAHYDNWAYRWLGWTSRIGPWFTFWLPPPGAPPIEVNSAFGGLAIYKTQPYLEAEYSGEDCEHVPFHRRMKEKGWSIHLNPAQRCVMAWLIEADEEPCNGGRDHRDDQH